MSQNEQFQQIANEAADPNVDPNRLRQIAAEYPGLHLIIAQNPVAYDGLLDWLAAQGNPDVVAAIAQRRGASNGFSPASVVFPAENVAATPEDTEKKSMRLLVIFLVLAILAIVSLISAVGIATGMFNDLFSSGSSKQAPVHKVEASTETPAKQDTESDSDKEAKTDSDAESVTEPSPEDQINYPEPGGSQNLPVFSSPSQNIFCSITPNQAFCAISTRDYAKDGPDACFGIFGMKIAGKEHAVTTCNDPAVNSLPGSAPVLQYGSSASNDKYACTMSESGVTCWNKFSGAQFSLRRAAFQVEQR